MVRGTRLEVDLQGDLDELRVDRIAIERSEGNVRCSGIRAGKHDPVAEDEGVRTGLQVEALPDLGLLRTGDFHGFLPWISEPGIRRSWGRARTSHSWRPRSLPGHGRVPDHSQQAIDV